MIDDSILDEILPNPSIDDQRDAKIAELQDAGFVITNWASGGVWYTLLMIILAVKYELVSLLRSVLSNMFLTNATGTWLVLKAMDYSISRKAATKTQGLVTISRDAAGDAVIIPKGQVFKTAADINGDQLRYFSLTQTILPESALSMAIPVEAEYEGAKYNVPVGQITQTLTAIGGGVNKITNAEGWITSEGADIEDLESLRARTLRSWSAQASRSIHDTYQNACEAVTGVLHAEVNDEQPRGQGTIDCIITGTAGAASDSLLDAVRAAVAEITGPYDNVLVKSSETVEQDVAVTVTVASGIDTADTVTAVTSIITGLLAITAGRDLNELYLADIIAAVKNGITAKNVKVTTPTDDVVLTTDKVIILGAVTVTVQKET